jgi:murein DD-endopeptidase MepM/ murein hydrolase activator NlpD
VSRILVTAQFATTLSRVAGFAAALVLVVLLSATIAQAAVAAPSPTPLAQSETGGATPPQTDPQAPGPAGGNQRSGEEEGTPTPPTDGGAGYHPRLREEGERQRRRRGRPVLTKFRVSRSALFAFGRPATISYRIRDRSRYVRVSLAFVRADASRSTHRVDLGRKRTRITHSFRWRGTDERRFAPQGVYQVRLEARDPTGNLLVKSTEAFTETPIEFSTHRFPVLGPHSLGGPDSRFGARRKGHRHQGQDISAAEGTPVVAPRGGLITWRAYQAEGAGYYLVLAGEGEPYHYVFMHLQRGSILVDEGDRVLTGQTLAKVGNTGASSGSHLHFEIWHGPWSKGGQPIDPLPRLLAWKGAG